MYTNKVRAIISIIPLSAAIFVFGMMQVIGIEASYAKVQNILGYFGFDQFSLLNENAKEGTYSINGRTYATRYGYTSMNEVDSIDEYAHAFPLKKTVTAPTENGGNVVAADAESINIVAIERDEKSYRTKLGEMYAQEIVTERQNAIKSDQIIQQIIADMKAADITPIRIRNAIQEYARKQSISDELVASFFIDMLARVKEVKRQIDVPGVDLHDIRRYPGSVRILNAQKRENSIHLVAYENKSSVASNADHYYTSFKQEHWGSAVGFEQAAELFNDQKTFLFVKPDKICLCHVKEMEDGFVRTYLLEVDGFYRESESASFR